MKTAHSMQLFWRGRDGDKAAEAARLERFLAAAAGTHRDLGDWHLDGSERPRPRVAGRDGCFAALERSRVDWDMGGKRQVSYQAHLLLDGQAGLGHIELACCIPYVDLGPAFVPNRFSMTLCKREVWDEPAALGALFDAAVSAFDPDFGHLGTSKYPTAPTPLFSAGVPAVGWMTFLSGGYPPLPPLGKAEARARSKGTVIVAFPEMFDDGNASQQGEIQALRARLQEGGVLIPSAALAQRAPNAAL